MAHPGGRPKKYNSNEELEKVINDYFESCFEPIINKFGELVLDSNGKMIKKQVKPFTIGGLANALDMTRQSILNYAKKEEYFDTIMRAKRKCEVYAEERLFDKDGINGAKFTLINNFENWRERTEQHSDIDQKLEISWAQDVSELSK